MKKLPDKITFKYIKQKNSIYQVNGVYGGISPSNPNTLDIHFFHERNTIPDITTHELTKDGLLGKIIEQEKTECIIREIQCSINLDINTAKSIVNWINKKIVLFEEMRELSDEIINK